MRVPLLDLQEQLKPLREEILAAVTEVIDSSRYIMGPKVESLEEHVAAYCGSKFGVGVASGTDALLASLMTLGLGPGDRVLTTPFTFFATMGCILRVGATPVFADIDPVTFNIDPQHMADILAQDKKEGATIKALMPVHLYGQCADMKSILALAKEYDLPVIEDAAQAIGASYPMEQDGKIVWQRAGSMGDFGCFSFFPSKNLGGVGDGGMVVLNDSELAERLRIIRVHGGAPKYYHALVGGNFRLDPIQAVVLDIKLPELPGWHMARRENASRYERMFAAAGLAGEQVTLPKAVYKEEAELTGSGVDYHIYNQFVLRTRDRDALLEHLTANGVGVEIYYPVPLHRQKCVAHLDLQEHSFPVAEKAAEETLALPIYPELTEDMQQYVVDTIASFFRK